MNKEITDAFYLSVIAGIFIATTITLIISVIILRNELEQIKKDWKIFVTLIIIIITFIIIK